MLRPTKRVSRRRRYAVNRIKRSASYDTHDIAKLFGIHRNPVRQWFKQGLKPIDDGRPILVSGTVLRAFLVDKQQGRRRKCSLAEFYCFKCREPRRPWGDTADTVVHSDKIVRLTALCCRCETVMHKTVRWADIPKIAALMEIRQMEQERLSGCPACIVNGDL